jgi:hypothetical protein
LGKKPTGREREDPAVRPGSRIFTNDHAAGWEKGLINGTVSCAVARLFDFCQGAQMDAFVAELLSKLCQ